MKKINEIFSDYNSGENISSALVEGVTLKKKSNVLIIKIKSDKFIEPSEIEELNDFVKARFMLRDAMIDIDYSEGVIKKLTEDDFMDIISALSKNHPL